MPPTLRLGFIAQRVEMDKCADRQTDHGNGGRNSKDRRLDREMCDRLHVKTSARFVMIERYSFCAQYRK